MPNKKKSSEQLPGGCATEVPVIKRFVLKREEDSSGVSGTGIVAVGCAFPSGSCVIEWTSFTKSMSIFHSIAEVERLHGHSGKTTVEFLD